MPLMLDGASGRQVEKVRSFADELRRRIEVPIEFRDERLSTVVAKQRVQEARKTVRDTRYDAAAAALVLQSYLDETTGVTEIREDEGF
jgi:putative Holliday junction resolvase